MITFFYILSVERKNMERKLLKPFMSQKRADLLIISKVKQNEIVIINGLKFSFNIWNIIKVKLFEK